MKDSKDFQSKDKNLLRFSNSTFMNIFGLIKKQITKQPCFDINRFAYIVLVCFSLISFHFSFFCYGSFACMFLSKCIEF